MHGIPAMEVIRKIRELYNKEMLVIIVSAYDLPEVEDVASALSKWNEWTSCKAY